MWGHWEKRTGCQLSLAKRCGAELSVAVQHKVGRSSQEIPHMHHPLRGGSECPPEREGYQESPTEAKKTLIEQCFQEGVINTSIHGEQCSSAMFYWKKKKISLDTSEDCIATLGGPHCRRAAPGGWVRRQALPPRCWGLSRGPLGISQVLAAPSEDGGAGPGGINALLPSTEQLAQSGLCLLITSRLPGDSRFLKHGAYC